MIKNTISAIILSIICCTTTLGQNSRTLPMLEENADTRTAGMGDANMGETKSMFLYTNPTAFFQSETTSYASYTVGLYPDFENGRTILQSMSAGYRIRKKHALMGGFRYRSGLEIRRVNQDGTEGNLIHPNDISIDLAYAYNISMQFSAYLAGNFIRSYNGKTAYTGGVSGGVYWRSKVSAMGVECPFAVGAAFYDMGGKVKYGKESTNDLPTSLGLGGSLSFPINENHKINGALATRYFILPSDAASLAGGLGVEYEIFNLTALRMGYRFNEGNSDNNCFTFGVGCKLRFAAIDAAYTLANNSDYNILRLGLNLCF